MKYDSSSAFRRAVEDRLRMRSLQTGTPLVRLRKLVAFDRYLVRLFRDQPDQWVLKGGFALQLRLGERARTTKDIEVLALDSNQDILSSLRRAGTLNLDDWFSFEVELPEKGADHGGQRYQLRSFLDSRPFETFHVDVGIGNPMVEGPDYLVTPNLLSFAGIEPIAGLGEIEASKLRQAIQATFAERGTHDLPAFLTRPPADWARTYSKMAAEVDLSYQSLEEAFIALGIFLDPVLSQKTVDTWEPFLWKWD